MNNDNPLGVNNQVGEEEIPFLYKIMKKEYYEKALKDGILLFQDPRYAHLGNDKYERSNRVIYNAITSSGGDATIGYEVPSFSYCFSTKERFREVAQDEVLLKFNLQDLVHNFMDLGFYFMYGNVFYFLGKGKNESIEIDSLYTRCGIKEENKKYSALKKPQPEFKYCLLRQFFKGESVSNEAEYRFVFEVKEHENCSIAQNVDGVYIELVGDRYSKVIKNLFSTAEILN